MPDTSSYKKHWKGPAPFPEIEVYAKPHGGLQWICMYCGYLHSKVALRSYYRTARLRCGNQSCRRKCKIGVGFSVDPTAPKAVLAGKWNLNLANRLNLNYAACTETPGRIFGSIAWQCPDCNKFQESSANFFTPSVKCPCGSRWYLTLLIYKSSGPKNLTPVDWTPYAPKTPEPLPPEKVG